MADPKEPQVALGKAIRTLRDERNLTQEALAHGAGVTVGHLSKIERGLANATWGTVVAIATALGVSMGELGTRAKKLED